MNPYFDLHIHPSFKPYLTSDDPDKRTDCWEPLSNLIGIIRSQGSLDQMKEGGIQLAVVGLYAIERPLTTSFMLMHLAPLITFLEKRQLHFPNRPNGFDIIQEEFAHLQKSADFDPEHGRSFKIIRSIDEMEEGKLNLILAIEGAHGLENEQSALDNLLKVKQSEQRILYFTLVHMTQNLLATHAYGMKLIKKNDEFKPEGFGLRDKGKELIDLAYDTTKGHLIFLDIKHLSLVARRQFYAYRREKGYTDIPILATHMGFTGISWDPRSIAEYFDQRITRQGDILEVHYKRPQGIGRPDSRDETHFNPWSINLYNEEIVEILDSGGLIGLNLDQRILGAQKVEGEYYTVEEFNYILSGYKDKATPQADEMAEEGEFTEEPDELAVTKRALFNQRKHLRHMCNHILHAVKIGGERAWSQLCLGTDFDGLINPINVCESADELPKLEERLQDMLPQMMDEDKEHEYDKSNIEQKVRGIMYDNAVAFLQKHFR